MISFGSHMMSVGNRNDISPFNRNIMRDFAQLTSGGILFIVTSSMMPYTVEKRNLQSRWMWWSLILLTVISSSPLFWTYARIVIQVRTMWPIWQITCDQKRDFFFFFALKERLRSLSTKLLPWASQYLRWITEIQTGKTPWSEMGFELGFPSPCLGLPYFKNLISMSKRFSQGWYSEAPLWGMRPGRSLTTNTLSYCRGGKWDWRQEVKFHPIPKRQDWLQSHMT